MQDFVHQQYYCCFLSSLLLRLLLLPYGSILTRAKLKSLLRVSVLGLKGFASGLKS